MTAVHRFRGRTKEMRAELERLLPVLRAHERPRRRSGDRSEEPGASRDRRGTLRRGGARRAGGESTSPFGRWATRHPETVAALLMRAHTYQYSRGPDAALPAAEERVSQRSRSLRRHAQASAHHRGPPALRSRARRGRRGGAGVSNSSRRRSATRLKSSGHRAAWSGSSRCLSRSSSWRPAGSTRRSKTAATAVEHRRATHQAGVFQIREPRSISAAPRCSRRADADEALPDLTVPPRRLRQTLSPRHAGHPLVPGRSGAGAGAGRKTS